MSEFDDIGIKVHKNKLDNYWIVEFDPPIPLETAWRIYNHPVGKKSVRAHGHCGCVEPTWHGNTNVDLYHVDTCAGLLLLVKILVEDCIIKWNIKKDDGK